MEHTTTPTGPHCEKCGSTDREDLTTGDQGYSACCNEPVVDDTDTTVRLNRRSTRTF